MGALDRLGVEVVHGGQLTLLKAAHAREIRIHVSAVLACHSVCKAPWRPVHLTASGSIPDRKSLLRLLTIRDIAACIISEVLISCVLLLLELSLLLLTLLVHFVLELDNLGQLELLPRTDVHTDFFPA